MIPVQADRDEEERLRIFSYRVREGSRERIRPEEAEARLQKIMDEYAGGIRTSYAMNEVGLLMAKKKLEEITRDLFRIGADDSHELMLAHEVLDRVDVAKVLVAHLLARKETRWPGFQSRQDYPESDERYEHFVNSVVDPRLGIRIVHRTLKGELIQWDEKLREPAETELQGA